MVRSKLGSPIDPTLLLSDGVTAICSPTRSSDNFALTSHPSPQNSHQVGYLPLDGTLPHSR
jgi:hypothetical protein